MKGVRLSQHPLGSRQQLAVTYRAIEDLKPNSSNPRLHSKKQVEQIANSIATFGFNVPLLVNDDLRVLYAQAGRAEDVPSVTLQVREILRMRHRPQATYEVKNLAGLLDAARLISLVLSMVLVIVAMIALVISGVGIMNIMLVTVTERTREIGVRMAIGAPRGEIRWQFLIEALIISGSGAVMGILIAASVPVVVNLFLPANLSISLSWLSILLAFSVTCLSGALFGYLPANRAAKLQPTESLRYE